jgi:hypothetical protein
MRILTLKKTFSPCKIPYIINRYITRMLHSPDLGLSVKKEDISTENVKQKKDWSSVKDIRQESKTFGTRLLENKEDVWHHNAW